MKFLSTGSPAASAAARKRSRQTRRGERGFTLLEALCAVTILAIALSSLFAAYRSGVSGVQAGSDYASASVLAQSLMSAASVTPGAEGTLSRGRNGRFAWQVAVTAPPAASPGAVRGDRWALRSLTVTVAWPPQRQVQLNSLRVVRTIEP